LLLLFNLLLVLVRDDVLAGVAEPGVERDRRERRSEAEGVEALVAHVAEQQPVLELLGILIADGAGHVLEPVLPFLERELRRLEAQVLLAVLRAAQALRQRRLEAVKLVVEVELLVLEDVLDRENANADLSEDVPLLGDAVRVARVVNEPREVAFVGWVDHLVLVDLHHVSAGRALGK